MHVQPHIPVCVEQVLSGRKNEIEIATIDRRCSFAESALGRRAAYWAADQMTLIGREAVDGVSLWHMSVCSRSQRSDSRANVSLVPFVPAMTTMRKTARQTSDRPAVRSTHSADRSGLQGLRHG